MYAIITRYIGASALQPARISAHCHGITRVLSYDPGQSSQWNHKNAAEGFLVRSGAAFDAEARQALGHMVSNELKSNEYVHCFTGSSTIATRLGRNVVLSGQPQFLISRVGSDADGYTTTPAQCDGWCDTVVAALNLYYACSG